MGKKENIIEQYLFDQIKALGGKCWKLRSQIGQPDRLLLLPLGFHALVECKAPDGELRKIQEVTINELKDLMQPVFVVSTKEEVDQLITLFVRSLQHAVDEHRRATESERVVIEKDVHTGETRTKAGIIVRPGSLSALRNKPH